MDDLLKEITKEEPIQRKGFMPALFNSEVLTREIVAEYQGIDAEQAIWEIADSIEGLLIGDKGSPSTALQAELQTQNILLETPLRSNLKDIRPVCLWLNRHAPEPLQFEHLVSAYF